MYEVSSDSDDDCYGKFHQQLQKLKNKLGVNNVVRTVNDSLDDKEIDSCDVSLITQDSDIIPVLDLNVNRESTNLITIDTDTPLKRVSARSRRGKRKNSDIQLSPVTQKRGRGRGKTGSQSSVTSVSGTRSRGRGKRGRGNQIVTNDSMTVDIVTPPPRRGSRNRRRGSQQTAQNSQSIITYSIGNTDEYPDASDNQSLFSNKSKTIEPITTIDLDEDESLDNEELSVKVYWQHSEVHKFNIRRLQKLTQLFDFFVNKAGVSRDHLLFTYKNKKSNKILRPDDTPESIDYNIAKFIEGGVLNKQFSLKPSDSPQKTGFVVKFQCQNKKKPLEVAVGKDEKLQLPMLKCAEHLEIPITQLVFEFDGETVQGNSTPSNLDMESGDCVDVKVISK